MENIDHSLIKADMQRAVHDAALSLFSDLSLDGVLQRIVHAACDLVGAQYAALGIPDPQGGLAKFISSGLSAEAESVLERLPEGQGLIGEMLRGGTSVRIDDISAHPKLTGFPENHPRMTTFLGVPIIAYGKTVGQIYLTDKTDGSVFSEADQQTLEMFTSYAAAAIENAQLYRQVLMSEAELTQRNEELELIHSLTGLISSSMELSDLLDDMFTRVLSQFSAGVAEIFLVDEASGVYKLMYRNGEPKSGLWLQQHFRPGEGSLGETAQLARVMCFQDLASVEGLVESAMQSGYNMIVGLPLLAQGTVVGVASLGFRGKREFGAREIGLLKAVGSGVGVAIMVARLNRQARRVAILEERERIAMDLHDGIIQSIYAVGLTLDYARMLIDEDSSEAKERQSEAIDGLNAVIRDIRSYILDLQPSRIRMSDLREGLVLLIREFKANSLVDAELLVEDNALVKLDAEDATALFLIAQEALSNVAKHAKASRVWVSVRELDSRVSLQIIDNGIGFDQDQETGRLGHGLNNMTERARQAKGEVEVISSPGEGTTITILVDGIDNQVLNAR